MPDLTPQSPLMSVVEYDGQMYYTSQYFHRQYIANSEPGKGKYQRHHDFRRMLHSIKAYQEFLEAGHVVELAWERVKTGPKQIVLTLKPLFHAAGYADLILINATMQLALTHQLDDALSKQTSVAINTRAAEQQQVEAGVSSTTLLLRRMLEVSETQDRHAVQLAQQSVQIAALQVDIAALHERQPPVGKITILDWLRRYSKPFLPQSVLSHLKSTCRRREDPAQFRPDGHDFPLLYYAEATIAEAYDNVTRQLSFFNTGGKQCRTNR